MGRDLSGPPAGGSSDPASDARARLPQPERIGPYRIRDVIARGGMAVVYRAEDLVSGAQVAVKTLRGLEPGDLESLRREAHALGRLRHPGVVGLVSQGVEQGVPWYAMEVIEGRPLDSLWEGRPIPPPAPVVRESLRWLRHLCATLAFLHGEGIVHRDLKPANIVMRASGEPVLVDFGLVSRFGGPVGREALEVGGAMHGTVAYMAPEQARGEYVDARADLYALGCILYEAVTGHPPFSGKPRDVVLQHLEEAPVRPSRRTADVPPRLDALIVRLLAKDPRERLGYAADVAAVLDEFVAGDSIAVPGRPYLYRPAFAGRAEALGQMAALLRGVADGRGACVFMVGESGAGKTRLAMEVTREATRRGFRVATGECVPLEATALPAEVRAAPLHPFRPLLRSIADHCRLRGPETTARLLGRAGPVLAAYEQSLATLPGVADQPEPAPLPAQAARNRLLAELGDTIRAFAADAPLVLVLDDLQWADELTLAFLSGLPPDFYATNGVLVIGTFRREEMGEALRALTAAPAVTVLDLARMDSGSVAAIVSDMLAMRPPPEPLVHFLVRESEGNPFFVSEYLHTAVGTHLLRRTESGEWLVAAPGREAEAAYRSLPLPRTVRELVGRRLEHLGATAGEVLEAAAVLGRDFDLGLAAALAAVDEAGRLEAVSQLLARHVVEELDGTRLRFAHDKVREVAYARIPPERAAALHRRAAAAVEDRHGGDPDFAQHYAVLAHHWSMAGVDEKALEYLGKAGEHALRTGAQADAHALLSRALALDERAGRRAGRVRRARWLRMLGEASFGMGDVEACRRHTTGALAELGTPVPRSRPGWSAALVGGLARQAVHRFVPERLIEARAERRETLLEAAVAAGWLSQCFYFTGDILPLLAALTTGVNLAERAAAPTGVTQCYARIAFVAGVIGFHRLARAYFGRAHAHGRRAGDDWGLGLGLYLDAGYHLGLGDWEHSREVGEESVRLLEMVGDRHEAGVARTIVANALYYAGRFEDARQRCRTTLESARARANPQHMGWGLFLSGRSLLALGEVADAVPLLEEGRAAVLPLEDRFSIVMCEGPLANALLAAGQPERAATIAGALARRLHERPPSPYAPCVDGYAGLAEAYLGLWEREDGPPELRGAARRACADLRRFARIFRMARPAALRCAAAERWLSGRQARARRLWRRSIRAARSVAMPYEEARAHAELARRAARPAERDHHREQARRLFSRLGCRRHLQELGGG